MVCCVAGSAGKSKDWRQPFAASNDGFIGEPWMLPQADFKRNLVREQFPRGQSALCRAFIEQLPVAAY
jgi:hypothetical protein